MTANHEQITQAEVKQMYKERRYAEIEKARLDGRLDTLLGIATKETSR